MRLSVDQVLRVLAKRYGVAVDDLIKGRRGKDNGPRKIGMYLAKELCEMKLTKIAGQFGAGGYGMVGWACHGVAARMRGGRKVQGAGEQHSRICQQKI